MTLLLNIGNLANPILRSTHTHTKKDSEINMCFEISKSFTSFHYGSNPTPVVTEQQEHIACKM